MSIDSPWPVFSSWARRGLALLALVSLIWTPLDALADRTINSATLNGGASVTVAPGATITAAVNVTTTGSGSNTRWRSTGWLISTTPPGSVTCVDHPNHDVNGSFNETFSITAPLVAGTYSAYFIAYNNDSCSGGASTTYTLSNGVTVTANPVPTTTSISPASKFVGAAGFTMTVNGTGFVSGSSVVRFNGANRTTTFISTTQLQATIPASDMLTAGSYNITVFNPTPGGGTSNAQVFTVSPGPPAATTNAATGVTKSVATLNGTVSANGASTTVTFEWGLTAAYGETIAATPGTVASGTSAVSATVEDVNCNTLFHYRVKATNSVGTTTGLDNTFTTTACTSPYPATACAATRYGTDLGCTANDVSLTAISLAPGGISSCVSGTPVLLDLDLTVNFSSPDRYDVGVFIANDGKLPTVLPANGGAGSCSVDVLPITPPAFGYTFPDLDGVPQGTADSCGDGNSSINGGTGSGVKRMTGVSLPCYASPSSGGKLFVPFSISWNSQKSPIGSLCTSNLYPVPGTSAKCNAPLSSVAINVVVLPVVTISDGITSINPGANTTYTAAVTNNSGGTLQDSVFKSPAVTDPLTPLTINSVVCTASGGATCPAMTSAAMITAMQGAGITIPSASLPNNGSLSFAINATLAGTANLGSNLIKTASITIGSNTSSASDSDLIVLAPYVTKSFASNSISEGAASLLTITLTNPTASPITGVAFTDTYPAGLVNTSSAGGATSCGGTVTAANDGGSVALSGGTIPASSNCTVTVNVTSATAGSYLNSTGTVSSSWGSISAASATLTVNVALFGAFNACDVAAAPNANCTNTTTSTNSRITTKIAGTAFTLDLVALKTNGTRNTSYNSTVLVELLDASNNGGALDAYNCRNTWTVITPTLTPNPAFSPSDNGLINVGPFTVPEAYRDVRVRVTNVGGSSKIGCSTDNFSIRPNTLIVSATDNTWTTIGTTRSLNNTSATGPGCSAVNTPVGCTGVIHKAGQAFTVTATAKNSASATTLNYTGTPAVTTSACAGTACTAGTFPFVLGTASTFASGVLTSNLATYAEVGAFTLTLQDSAFATVDASDTAASCAGYYVCGSTSAGRFVPDHLSITANSIVPGCGTFTYFGQDGFTTTFTLTAENSSNATTANYVGIGNAASLAKLPLTAWGAAPASTSSPGFGFAASSWAPSQPAGAAIAASATAPTATNGNTWVAGTTTVTAKHQITRPTAPAVPTTTTVSSSPVDSDGVTVSAPVSLGAPEQRFGMLRMDNSYGSELLPIRVAVRSLYCKAVGGSACTQWLTNTADSCTSFTPAIGSLGVTYRAPATVTNQLANSNFRITGTDPNTGAGSTGNWMTAANPTTLNQGIGTIILNRPCEGGPSPDCTTAVGSVDLTLDLSTNFPWLMGTWTSAGAWNESPTARLKFGSPKAPYIYLRERY
ncbi:MAG: hypothetical protein K9J74_00770 [Sulfuritalea sp.]|nr:hypothetical protein [Sulfuritalea sp.]